MARDRQRAKQRQADRRARRLAQEGGAGAGAVSGARARKETPPAEDAAPVDGGSRVEDAEPADGAAPVEDAAPVAGAARAEDAVPVEDAVSVEEASLIEDPRVSEPAPGISPELAVGAPPQEEGRSDQVIADDPPLEPDLLEEDEVDEDFDDELIDDEDLDPSERGAGAPTYSPKGRRGRDDVEGKSRPRVVQFLIAVWAELQRVQWPDRQALTTLTGVVLGFVLIAGGYLGLLDAIFSRLIQAIL